MMRDICRLLVSPVLLLLLLTHCTVTAQETTGSISGVVKDASGAVLPDVAITVENQETGRRLQSKSADDGTYMARDLAPGRYSVKLEKAGFDRAEVANVLVLLGKNSRADSTLRVGSMATSVEVSESASLIDTTSTMVAHNVTAEEFNNIPKGRTFQGVAVLSPSVTTGNVEGGYQINGASAAENNYYIDGVSTNSQIDGSARQKATFEYLQEVQVKTAGLEAEYGGALGGVVTAVTKSGGNSFHGEVHYYYYGNGISSAPTERLQIDPLTQTSSAYFQDRKNKSDNHEFGGSIGGPIVKNKLWFYSSISPQYVRQTNDYLFDNGVTPGSMDRKAYYQSWFNKLSFDPTSRIRTNFTYLNTTQRLTGQLYAYDGMGANFSTQSVATAQALSNRGFHQPESTLTGQVDFTLSNTSLISVKGGRYYLDYKDVGVPATYYTWWQASSIGITGVPSDLQKASNYSTPSAAQTLWDLTTRTYIQADFSKFVKLAGTHNFKVGVGTTKNVNNVNQSKNGIYGRVLLYPGKVCTSCVAPQSGAYGYYVVQDYSVKGTTGANITHLYVQDSWHVLPRLSINVGLRTEKEAIPTFRRDIRDYAFQFGFGDKLSPRFGASLDVLGDGKLKISAGWGRYFDWTKYELARGTFGAEIWHDYYRTLDSPDGWLSLNLLNMPGQNIWKGTFRDRRVPGFDTVDKNIKPMSVDSLTAGVEYEVRSGTVFAARYSRSKLNRTIEDIGTLDSTGSEAYLYGNPGESMFKYGLVSGATCSVKDTYGNCSFVMPTAQRVYDAMELSITRRFRAGWFGSASYVYSKLWGNYPGLQNSDEIRPPGYGSYTPNQGLSGTNYRPGGNASRAFDLDEQMFDAHGNAGVFGRLPTDRPHQLKLYGSKIFKFGTEIGAFYRIMSGTPVSTEVTTVNDIPMYAEGRGDLGRTPVFSQTDLLVAHEIKFGEVRRLRFEFNATNLFNQKTNMYTFPYYNIESSYTNTGIDLSKADLTKGFDWKAMVAAVPGTAVRDPRFNKAGWYNAGFGGRAMVKFIF
jgi:hypothetical protein